MGILRTNKISGLGTDGTVFQGVTRFDTQGYFVAPSGTTDQRNAGITTTDGTIRFNTDSQKLEFYAQSQWWEMVIDTPALGVAANTGAGARGLFTGGYASGAPAPKTTSNIDYVNIASTGNAISFGSLSSGADQDIVRVGSSSTRGVFRDGDSTPMTYVTFASTGNSVSFGTALLGNNRANGLSNETRGIYGAGSSPTSSINIDYITIASTGNAVDFGNLATGAHAPGTGASSTRGIFAGCAAYPASLGNAIEFITIATLGNAQDFGDLTAGGNSYQTNSSSNSTRMFVLDDFMIEKIQIQTLGNAVDFGDTSSSTSPGGGCASPTRALFGGGNDPAVRIEYINIATEGNAVSFGDLTYIQNRHGCGTSNAHGGL
jgi:hypothetical protein